MVRFASRSASEDGYRPACMVSGNRTSMPRCAEKDEKIAVLQAVMEDQGMAESVYKIIDLVGTSTDSWEKAALAAVEKAGKSLRDLRIAEIEQLDMQLENGKVRAYRAKVRISFKYED